MIDLRLGDCLEVMPSIPDGSVDMILADLPYGTTACKWDTVIPLVPLWEQYKRVIKRNGAIVLTASQPFTTTLIASNMAWFKYTLVWHKSKPSLFLSANFQPLRAHEDICVFSGGKTSWAGRANRMAYYPQGLTVSNKQNRASAGETTYQRVNVLFEQDVTYTGYPTSVLQFPTELGAHSTQKPVALMEYLIRTYTNEGETVLDNTMGSGTTGVACVNPGRNFIGIEKDAGYFQIATERIRKAQDAPKQLELEAG